MSNWDNYALIMLSKALMTLSSRQCHIKKPLKCMLKWVLSLFLQSEKKCNATISLPWLSMSRLFWFLQIFATSRARLTQSTASCSGRNSLITAFRQGGGPGITQWAIWREQWPMKLQWTVGNVSCPAGLHRVAMATFREKILICINQTDRRRWS